MATKKRKTRKATKRKTVRKVRKVRKTVRKAAPKRRKAKSHKGMSRTLSHALKTHGKTDRQKEIYAQYYEETKALRKKYFGK